MTLFRQIVLVVEDEPLLRMYAVDIVEGAGFEALEAETADAAIFILESRLDIRIVFTDIDMPGSMDGLKLAAAVRRRWPPVNIIITSGMKSPSNDDMPANSLFFGKPYQSADISTALQSFAA